MVHTSTFTPILIEVNALFQLMPATFFLATKIFDRYCSKYVVYKRYIQLLRYVTLLIAAKYGGWKIEF
jgi:hypothetical protein